MGGAVLLSPLVLLAFGAWLVYRHNTHKTARLIFKAWAALTGVKLLFLFAAAWLFAAEPLPQALFGGVARLLLLPENLFMPVLMDARDANLPPWLAAHASLSALSAMCWAWLTVRLVLRVTRQKTPPKDHWV